MRLGQYSRSRRRTIITPLAPSIRDPVLDLHLDWSGRVGDAAPYFRAHGAAYLLGHRGERLASGRPAALRRAIIASNDGSTQLFFTVLVRMSAKPASLKSNCSRDASPSTKVRVTASARLGTCRARIRNLVIIAALWHPID